MALQKPRAYRKLRTREHILEGLSINYFERFALLCGFSVEKIDSDYGYDLLLFTYDMNGEIESGSVRIQMKSSESISYNRNDCVTFDVDTRDLNLWLTEFDPVLFVIYDAKRHKAYWIDIQKYLKLKSLTKSQRKQLTYRVVIPKKNRINSRSLRKFAQIKNERYNSINSFYR